ncbi:nuclear transport factor 2 family protein [Sphingomonas sp.]|uniref:nuclear transport factor 2 family protein n=1 Tax=Sphingomonas sp. TaxID=28214 RepID=UPI001B1CC56C|nr:nuclear transport factor 2 family protein [Sphingomonas sp.]MBO9712807.1 nuclear transport factor 2 family protein [Sphingomonas sp.]
MDLDPQAFAAEWAAAWNARDLEAVLRHFHEHAVFTSPFAAQIVPESGGRLTGKPAIRAYWAQGLARIPDLRFSVDRVFTGVDTIVIAYTNQKGGKVSEVLRFEGGKVIEGHGTYAG